MCNAPVHGLNLVQPIHRVCTEGENGVGDKEGDSEGQGECFVRFHFCFFYWVLLIMYLFYYTI